MRVDLPPYTLTNSQAGHRAFQNNFFRGVVDGHNKMGCGEVVPQRTHKCTPFPCG